jgi:catalase
MKTKEITKVVKRVFSIIIGTTAFGAVLSAASPPPSNTSKPSELPDNSIHTPAELVQSMRSAFGSNASRAIHAKGIIREGDFIPDPHAKELTKAPHFQGIDSKVTVRFSDFSGDPTIADNARMANPRGIAIRFHLPGGSSSDLVAISFNGFPVSNTDDLRELMLAIAASGPSAAAPTALDRFLDSHPSTKKFVADQKTPASFATISYFGVGCLKFTNAKGEAHYVRYQLLPEAGEELLAPEQQAKVSHNYLMDEIRTRVAAAPIAFELYAQVADRGDKLDDPSVAWPDTRRRVSLGKLQITKVTPNTIEEDRGLIFAPNNVPDGIQIADPLLVFYAKAFRLSAKQLQDATVGK